MGAGSKNRTLLLELLLSVFIFSVCAVICSSLFLAASKTAADSRELSEAVFMAQSVAESFKAHNGDIADWQTLKNPDGFDVFPKIDEIVAISQSADDPAQSYIMMRLYSQGNLDHAEISVLSHHNGVIYSLNVSKLASEVKP